MAGKRGKAGSAVRDVKRLEAMIEEAIVDCYGDAEQAGGLLVMIEEHLSLPFTTQILGVAVEVVGIDQDDDDKLVAICKRAGKRQRISLSELPLPSPPPEGAEWIAAYRHWARHCWEPDE